MEGKRSVRLTVVNDTGEERMVMSYDADLYRKGANTYYRYREQEEMGDTVTLLKIGPEEIRIVRQGEMESEQAFAVGEARTGYYRTAQGLLSLATRTSRIAVQLEEGIGTVEWEYSLELAGDAAGTYRISIHMADRADSTGETSL
ncbi:DUF1934 domain-containing protein [Gorillibacterium sp. CAU 1737]|uniref:DUF1934 domain-containing protein n=1 Tax=Gorillibacterium sp. CAU 1737 TaxID=3140362 RepID=UPI0032602DD6